MRETPLSFVRPSAKLGRSSREEWLLLSIRKCSFCGKDVIPGTGIQIVRNDGSVLYFCSNKCRLNQLKLKRDPRKLKWTSKHVKGGKGI